MEIPDDQSEAQPPEQPAEEAGTRMDRTRFWLNKNTLTVTILSNLVLLCALITIVYQIRPKAAPPWPMAYYYDLSTDGVFVARTTEFPPIFTPQSRGYGKRNGVRAYVFSCGDCSKKDPQRYIGFLEAYTNEAKQALENAGGYSPGGSKAPGPLMPDVMYMMSSDGHLVASPDKHDKWVNANTDEGRAIMTDALKKCGPNTMARTCLADEDPLWHP
jgi:hypothetical protein